MSSDLTGQTVELLQALIRNACVNDGTATSGHETRNSQLLQQFLGSTGLELQSSGPPRSGSRWWPASRAPTPPRPACA